MHHWCENVGEQIDKPLHVWQDHCGRQYLSDLFFTLGYPLTSRNNLSNILNRLNVCRVSDNGDVGAVVTLTGHSNCAQHSDTSVFSKCIEPPICVRPVS